MPNNKDNTKGGSKGSMPNTPDHDFESQGKNKSGFTKGADSGFTDDDMTTAGGKKGQFSDKDRGSEGQWSPGSTHESDR